MKNTIHLILISAQSIPNITPILDERFRPDQVIMLLSESMKTKADHLELVYKPRGIKVSRWPIEDAWDIVHIRERVTELLAEFKDFDIVLNATCGTKLMSIAAYEVFRVAGKPIFYIHPNKDHLIWMYPQDLPSVDLRDKIKLKEYFLSYGATQVKENYKDDVSSGMRKLTQEIINNIKLYAPELSTLNRYARKRNTLRSETIATKQSDAFWQLVALFQQAGLLESRNVQLIFKDEASRFLVNGGWLEMYAYACCLNLQERLGIQDIACGVSVHRLTKGRSSSNELDIALLKDNRLYLLECKTGNIEKNSKGAETLYKLDSIKGSLAGIQAKSMLVSFNPIKADNLGRAKEYNIEICCSEDLKFLEKRIVSWLGE
jgi:hypothetical protein